MSICRGIAAVTDGRLLMISYLHISSFSLHMLSVTAEKVGGSVNVSVRSGTYILLARKKRMSCFLPHNATNTLCILFFFLLLFFIFFFYFLPFYFLLPCLFFTHSPSSSSSRLHHHIIIIITINNINRRPVPDSPQDDTVRIRELPPGRI